MNTDELEAKLQVVLKREAATIRRYDKKLDELERQHRQKFSSMALEWTVMLSIILLVGMLAADAALELVNSATLGLAK